MSVGVTLFMFYMIGNSIQIITILITIGMVIPQITALFRVGETFEPLEDEQNKGQLVLYKLMYCGFHIAILAAAIYKFSCIVPFIYEDSYGVDSSASYWLALACHLRSGKLQLNNS